MSGEYGTPSDPYYPLIQSSAAPAVIGFLRVQRLVFEPGITGIKAGLTTLLSLFLPFLNNRPADDLLSVLTIFHLVIRPRPVNSANRSKWRRKQRERDSPSGWRSTPGRKGRLVDSLKE
jgi:hypothetical protein